VLAGKYRIQRRIGRGGMAEVYAATHEVLQQTVAIKILLPDVAANSGATARFINEARAAARIRGENVAAVTDVGSLDDGTAFMVLEYLEGEDLEDYAMREGPLAPELAVDFLLQALQALAQAHTQGFVHRDIKPSNLFLSRRHDGATIVKVLDFGISKAPRLNESTEGHATSTRTVLGSPYYMAPEQARSARSVDPRADQWAVGVTLYRLLTGELPFGGETLTELLLEIVEATPLRPRSYRPDLPEGLERVVLRCLKKDRAERFANVAELAQALQPFAGADGAANVARISRTMGMARPPLASASAIGPLPTAAPAPAPLAAEAVTNEPDLASGIVSTPQAHELRPAGYEATAALAGAANDTEANAGVTHGTAGGKPPSSGGATAPTIPAPPMPPRAALGGTQASAGVGTHAGWAEASVDSPGAGVRSPRLVLAGVAALAMVAGIAIVLASARGAHPAPVTTEGPTKTAESTASSASFAASTSVIAPASAAPPATGTVPTVPAAATIVAPSPPVVTLAPAAPPSVVSRSPAAARSAPATRVAAPHPVGTAKASPPAASAHAVPAPAAPAQDTYDVLNQRN
jgi:serine/threonine-protein kinase